MFDEKAAEDLRVAILKNTTIEVDDVDAETGTADDRIPASEVDAMQEYLRTPRDTSRDDVVLMMRGQIAVAWEKKARFWRRVSCCLATLLLIAATYFLGAAL